MLDKIRWGIISTASIGRRRVTPAIQAASNSEVIAVASRSLESAQEYATELNIPKAYASYEELLADPDIDAIYNPLPNHLHAEWSIKCAEAGKATLCEKPFASDAPEAQTIVDAFAEKNILLAEAFMYRFHPQHQKVKELIAEGQIGDIVVINSAFTFPISDEANIRLQKSMAGGGLMDVGCYCVNLMRFITGEEPERVTASAIIGKSSGVDELLAGTLQFPSGVIGHFDSGLRAQFENCYQIKGTAGKIIVNKSFTPQPHDEQLIQLVQGDDVQEFRIPAVNQYTLMAEDFADALINNRAPRFMPQDAVQNMEVLDALYAQVR